LPVEIKPLFRPEVLGHKLKGFRLPDSLEQGKTLLQKWAGMISSGPIDKLC